jgi:hypothetical protein
MTSLFPIDDPELCHCDIIHYEPVQFNLKMRAYREPEFRSGQPFRYYLLDFFFAVYFQGPMFWQGMTVTRGSEADMAAIAPFALDRRQQMKTTTQLHYPKLYNIETTLGPVRIIAGIARVYAHDSVEPLSVTMKDPIWLAGWEIVYEEGLPGT